jgi:hypothetical protein
MIAENSVCSSIDGKSGFVQLAKSSDMRRALCSHDGLVSGLTANL